MPKFSHLPPRLRAQLPDVAIGVVLIAYTFWIYRNALDLGFNSDAFALMSPIHFSGLRGSVAWDGTYHYMPVTSLWLWVQHLFLGLNEPAYQVVNVAQHGIIACLLYWFAKALLGRRSLAALAALLFAGSASYYEVVYWSIVGSNYHVSMFFYLVGLLALVRHLRYGERKFRWLFTACVGLSLFSHELTLSLLPVGVCYYLFVHVPRDEQRQFWRPWFVWRVWLDLGRLMLGPLAIVGLFLAVKLVMSMHSDVTGQPQSMKMASYLFMRGLFSALTFRGDDGFIAGRLVNLLGSGPQHAWLWLAGIVPLLTVMVAFWSTRVERFLLLWLAGQLAMTQLAIGISARHLYMPTMVAAVLIVDIGWRGLNRLLAPLEARHRPIQPYGMVVLYGLSIALFVPPAYRDLTRVGRLWKAVSDANQSLKGVVSEALKGSDRPRKLYVINATKYVAQDGFSVWTFQNGLASSIHLGFTDRFTEVRQLHFAAGSDNVANGSRAANMDEMDLSIVDDPGYVFVVYVPKEYRFVRLTRAYLAERGVEQAGLRGLPSVYSPESAPTLAWQEGAWPWFNLLPGASVHLPLKNPEPDRPTWLALYNLAQDGRDLAIEVDGRVIGTLKAPPNRRPTWLNQTVPLPAHQGAIIDLTLRSCGTEPANFARVGVLVPRARYTPDSSPALWWDVEGRLSVPPGEELTLPLVPCSNANCELSIHFLAQQGHTVALAVNGRLLERRSAPLAREESWHTATVAILAAESTILTMTATGTAPGMVKEIGVR